MKTPTVYVPGPARYPRILTYYEISAQIQFGITAVSPQRFLDQLQFLKESEIRFVPLKGLSERVPEHSVCLTVDDGYSSFHDHALPI